MIHINVLEYLENSVNLYPDKIALKDEKNEVSYREYFDRARSIGTYISNKNVGINKPVAVMIDRNIESIICFIGVLYSGNFYVPIDYTMPEERINLIIDTLKPALIIDTRDNRDGDNNYDEIIKTEINDKQLESIRNRIIDTDPLYTLFTSGSTGVPKGATICHKGVIDLVEAFQKEFAYDENCVFGNQAPFDFDVSTKDIYLALMCSGTVVVVPKRLFMQPKPLLEYIDNNGINTLIWSVSALRILADFKALRKLENTELRYVMMCGEVMPMKALNYWMDNYPKCRFVNLYGPTEITCNCSFYEVDRRFNDDEVLPIGKPFKNTRIILLDEDRKLITDKNEIGEICVVGSKLALGYWNNLDKTKSSFINNPLRPELPERIYTTGDMAYYDEDDNLVFASRKDFQIKHMGHRIELGEIESALNSLSYIDVACCLYNQPVKKIVCFYQAKEERTKDIINDLLTKLPKYMCPNEYIYFEKLPLNDHSKIDRQRLIREYFKEV